MAELKVAQNRFAALGRNASAERDDMFATTRKAGVQLLALAIAVGLGFGLQEVFANLISGLIIRMERPIRTGDLVTVNGTTGRVSRIRMRATTIVDSDRRTLLVPNKRFITEDVVNWTRSDVAQTADHSRECREEAAR